MKKETSTANKTYTVLPGTRMGILTREYLAKLAEIAATHDIPFFKITSAQRLAIMGQDPETAERVWQDLGLPEGPKKPLGIHYIQACPGLKWCKYGRQDSLALGEKLEKRFGGLVLPAKTKVGISGCPLNCCESYIRDIGIFGKKNGWTLVFGGNGGGCPRIGEIVAEDLNDEEVLELVGKCIDFFRENARRMERTGRLMRRTNIDKFWDYLGVKGKKRYPGKS